MKFYKSEILDDKRQKVWNALKNFSRLGVLGGGTALALQLGHRKSLDFDFFCPKPIEEDLLIKAKKRFGNIEVLLNSSDELTFLTSEGVKITFLYYPFEFKHKLFLDGLYLLRVCDIAAAKAYTLNRRGNFKDYVDLYFILKSGVPLKRIIEDARAIYGNLFSEKLFLSQLLYTKDINRQEFKEVVFMEGHKASLNQLEKYFKKIINLDSGI